MKNDMKIYEENNNNKNGNIFETMLNKQSKYNKLFSEYNNCNNFIYSMWKLNDLHLLIRTKTFGQLIDCNNNKYNCYATLKLDYLNQFKQAFITHHKMKSKGKINNSESLRDMEYSLYGIERLIESERLKLYILNKLRINNKLIIGRMQIPSLKLLSINIIKYKTLLNDKIEHIYLENRYKNGLYLINKLFKYLLNDIKCNINKQYLAYDSNTDSINIFQEIENKTNENEEELFSFHGFINKMCGIITIANDISISNEFILPYSILYHGIQLNINHIPNISPPTNSQLPKLCQMFLFHGLCPKQQLNNENNICEFEHYRTHTISHCWEYALFGGHCERGINCEWKHLKQNELIKKAYEMFHIRQLINYCQDYYRNNTCKNLQNDPNCYYEHFNKKQLNTQFNTLKKKQMNKNQLIIKAIKLEKELNSVNQKKKDIIGKKERIKTTIIIRSNKNLNVIIILSHNHINCQL